jgi:hypothetical protein
MLDAVAQEVSPVGIEMRRAAALGFGGQSIRFQLGLSPALLAVTFPQAPLRSRKAGFPRSGSDLGFPSWAFPETRRSSSTDIHTPRPRWFTHELVPSFPASLSRHCVRGPPWNRQAPRAPSLHAGVTVMQKTSRVSPPRRTLLPLHRSYWLMRQTVALLSPLAAPLAPGLCRLLSAPAAQRPFPSLSPPIFPYVSGPLLRWPQGALSRFFP